MGIPVPPPVIVDPTDAGVLCTNCWGSGKPFGSDGTPDEVVVSISGVNKGPIWVPADGPPINGVFVLPQRGFFNCHFLLDTIEVQILVRFEVGVTFAAGLIKGFSASFAVATPPACTLFFPNERTPDFEGGTMEIFLPEIV